MVWLAKWIRENTKDARVLIITDRTELDEQIEKVFKGVAEDIYRTKSGADLIAMLNAAAPWLLCSLIHKFGGKEDGESVGDIKRFVEELKKSLPKGFKAKGNLFVFVDECHRTQSGDLHEAMKAILPGAVFIGFTGTPLLKADKKKSIEIFGRYIHTYKFDEAVPTAWCWTCATRRATSTRASRRRPRSISGSRPRPRGSRPSPRPSSRSAGAPCRRCSPATRG
jgi:type I restriction enzyme R subunit